MKFTYAPMLLVLSLMSNAYCDSAIRFYCVPDNNFPQNFQYTSVSFALNQMPGSVELSPNSIAVVPNIPIFHTLEMNTRISSDTNGTPATLVTEDVLVAGQDESSQTTVLLALAKQVGNNSFRRTQIYVYVGSDQEPQEANLNCTVQSF
jgi:hypothetical protein